MKGMWRKVVGGVLATISVVGAALITYFVENGALPAWLSHMLGWLKDVLTLTTPMAVWELILPVLVIVLLGAYFVRSKNRKIKERDATISELHSELTQLETLRVELENSNIELRRQAEFPVPAQPILSSDQHQMLSLIADFENGGAVATLSNLLPHSKLQKLGTISALDDLIEHGLVHKIKMYIESKYQLTAAGRKFVLNGNQ